MCDVMVNISPPLLTITDHHPLLSQDYAERQVSETVFTRHRSSSITNLKNQQMRRDDMLCLALSDF